MHSAHRTTSTLGAMVGLLNSPSLPVVPAKEELWHSYELV